MATIWHSIEKFQVKEPLRGWPALFPITCREWDIP
jgi:hypothetical protein